MRLFGKSKKNLLPANPTEIEMDSKSYQAMVERYKLILEKPSSAISNVEGMSAEIRNSYDPLDERMGFLLGGLLLGAVTAWVTYVLGAGIAALPIFISSTAIVAMFPEIHDKIGNTLKRYSNRPILESAYRELRQHNYKSELSNNQDFKLLYDVMQPHIKALTLSGNYDMVRDFVEYAIVKGNRSDFSEFVSGNGYSGKVILETILRNAESFKKIEPILDLYLQHSLNAQIGDSISEDKIRAKLVNAILGSCKFNSCKQYIDKILAPVDLSKDDLLLLVTSSLGYYNNTPKIKDHLVKHHYVAKTATLADVTNPNRLVDSSMSSPNVPEARKSNIVITEQHIESVRNNLQSYDAIKSVVEAAVASGRIKDIREIGHELFKNVTRTLSEVNDSGLSTTWQSMAIMRDISRMAEQSKQQAQQFKIMMDKGTLGNIRRIFNKFSNSLDVTDISHLTRVDARISSTIDGSLHFIGQSELFRDYSSLMDDPLRHLETAIDEVKSTMTDKDNIQRLNETKGTISQLRLQVELQRAASNRAIHSEEVFLVAMRGLAVQNVADGFIRNMQSMARKEEIAERLTRDGGIQLDALRDYFDRVKVTAENHLQELEKTAEAYQNAAKPSPLLLPAPSNDGAIEIRMEVPNLDALKVG